MRKPVFNDKGIQKALGRYVKVVEGDEKARYLSADMEKKSKAADGLITRCGFCERNCKVNRKEGELGWCRVGYESRVASVFTHIGEEDVFVPSGTIFFSGCNARCVYCQNWDISQNPAAGTVWPPARIAKWIEDIECININFVGGEPTPNLHWILKSLALSQRNIPIIWNSNFYMSKETMSLLDGAIDVYLADFRYGCDECALKYSSVPRYMEVTTRNFLLAKKQAEVLVRVLVLPGHVDCCAKPIVKWIADNLGNDVRTNIMSQYAPQYKASEYPEINRRLKRDEYYEVVDYAKELGLWNIEVQEL
ncbi:MAG: radical SAM protein [Candidatus Diapherotrites archaeon]|nr:radical SAM protein [Candidatus Diapherotrites archaeon]